MHRARRLVAVLRLLVVAAVSVAAVLLVTGASERAGAQAGPTDVTIPSFVEQITSYHSDLQIEPSGSLLVHEQIVYDFGASPHHGIYRDITDRFAYDDVKPGYDRVTPIDVISVTASAGTPDEYTTETDGNNFRIKIGDPDTTITGVHTYDITFRARGVYNAFPDHDELVWNAVSTGWSVPISDVTSTAKAPADIPRVNCAYGPYGATTPCPLQTTSGSTAQFGVATLQPLEGMTVTVALPKGAVANTKPILEERFDFSSAFRVTPATGGISGGLLLLIIGAVVFFVWRFGRDRRYAGSAVDAAYGPTAADATHGAAEVSAPLREAETPVEFEPPDKLRPGQLGVLVDFRANPLDVTATIVDLAVRGYLRIEEQDPTGMFFRKHDWKLVKQPKEEPLHRYERTLYDALFEPGDTVLLSDLHNKFASDMQKVEKALMDDAMGQGWFRRKPGTTKGLWFALGLLVLVGGVALTVALASSTHAGLVGVPVVVGGLVLMWASRFMPARSAKGYAVLRHTLGFKRFIDESEKRRAEFAERANIFSEYLPYAVVFGATKKWAKAFGGLDDPPPDTSSWYVAQHPLDYAMFTAAIDAFAVTSVGTLTSTPASSGSSGFSGGGFSGGGFGGGGGGSW
jgi:uncharacterized protein (TIGR04222 family)